MEKTMGFFETPPEVSYTDGELTAVKVNVPTVLMKAVGAMASHFSTTKTNLICRALSHEAFFARLHIENPNARLFIHHEDGRQEEVVTTYSN